MDAAKKRKLNILLAVLLALTLAFIWGNSLLGREDSAAFSGELLESFSELFESMGLDTADDHWLRKTAHFTEFGVLGAELILLFFLNWGMTRQSAANAAFAALLTAVTDESLQYLSARAPEVKDVALDFAGSLTGIALASLLAALRRKRAHDQN